MKIDARKLKTEAQQEKRNIAIKLREKGISNQDSGGYSEGSIRIIMYSSYSYIDTY